MVWLVATLGGSFQERQENLQDAVVPETADEAGMTDDASAGLAGEEFPQAHLNQDLVRLLGKEFPQRLQHLDQSFLRTQEELEKMKVSSMVCLSMCWRLSSNVGCV